MKTKIISMLGAALAALASSSAHASLICGEAVSDGAYASGNGSWSRIVYEASTHAWTIEHHLNNGQIVSRADQYNIADQTQGDRLLWYGTQFRNPNLHMVGEVMHLIKTGEPTFNEWLYDDVKRAWVLHTVSLCRFEQPVNTSTPALPPPPAAYSTPAPTVEAPLPALTPATADARPTVNWDTGANGVAPIWSENGGSAFKVAVSLGSYQAKMLIDTGANSMSVVKSLSDELWRRGDADLGPQERVIVADGRTTTEDTIIIHTVTVGGRTLHNMEAGIVADGAMMLMPFPVLNQMGSFTIDTAHGKLIFGSATPSAPPASADYQPASPF
jgi:hypothetical protein